jgi:hypothetical protein
MNYKYKNHYILPLQNNFFYNAIINHSNSFLNPEQVFQLVIDMD